MTGSGKSLVPRLLCLIAPALFFAPPQAAAQSVPASCPASLASADLVEHDFSVSFCELCSVGTVRMVVENPYNQQDDVDFSDIVITENLNISGLTYVPGTTQFTADNMPAPPLVEPVVSGSNGSVLTWTLDEEYEIEADNGPGDPRLIVEFDVRRHANVDEEGLVTANRTIEATLEFTPSCDTGYRHTDTTGPGFLPLEEPEPVIVKTGRNVDAGQDAGSYTDTVYGHEGDDVIWRIEVQNDGDADLQDFTFSDVMDPGNYEIDYICDAEGDASSTALSGSGSGNCQPVGGVTQLDDVAVADRFGGGANPYIAAPAGGSGFYYLVGRVTDSCEDRTNTVTEAEWGCQVEPPPGGISATSDGQPAILDDARMETSADADGLDVDVDFIGAYDAGQPIGGRGRVRIRITNNTGGTIRGEADGLRLRNLLPAEYVVDPTFEPIANVAEAYGNSYGGVLDTVEWTNPAPGTYPDLTTSDPAVALSNTEPEFLVTSSTTNDDFPDQEHLLRHGDTLTVIFGAVLIDPQYYDREAWLDERTERPGSDPPNTDPTESFQIANELEIWFEEFCNPGTVHNRVFNDTDTAEPEDIDPDISGTELVFILTNTDVLPLTVNLNNNGGHDADDYFAYVTFGEAMVVQAAPGSCSVESNPPPMPVWEDPVVLPASATVYRCDPGRIGPNQTRGLDFEVVKNPDSNAEDDLTFRVDVIGEITLADGTPLWFPAPTTRGDGVLPRANDYTVDALWSRVVGYNLLKSQNGVCSENNPPPGSPDDEIQIGEECEFSVESGGWFGFLTPGFDYIAVQDVQVVDNIPDGQGYVSSTDPLGPGMSTAQILNVTLNPPPAPLDEAPFDWTHNTVVPGERITERDHWFRVDATTRLLNDPIDTRAPPNEHAEPSTNVLTSTFEAVFFNQLTDEEEVYDLGPSTFGYPPEFRRRVDLTVTEPELVLTKEVCNETLYGAGAGCSNFVDLTDEGDAFDTYVYRITVANEDSADGVTRAPAYDVTVTSETDPGDWLFVDPLETDGLDNDGDASADEGAAGDEGTITPDNETQNGTPAEVVASYPHSDALLRIDPGQSVVLYYRVDPDDDVAPQQLLTSTVYAEYDSLEDEFGNQSSPQRPNGDAGGARQYRSETTEAEIRIVPVEVDPKQVLRVSNSGLAAANDPQPVSIGEEVEFQLRTLIPVAQLRNFVVRDELPEGLSCAEAPVVDLDAPPYDAAGFVPGGSFTPTCTGDEVVWDFGSQTVSFPSPGLNRYDFRIQFITRVDNTEPNQDGLVIANGGDATETTVSYVNEQDELVVIEFEAAEVIVREPVVDLEKAFAVEEADADDVLTVTVTATNSGTAQAYNLRLLDDLTGTRFSYVGNVGGADPPVNVDTTTYGPDSPIFSWDPGFAIAVGGEVSFSFDVQVADDVRPHEILDNTVEADWTSLPGQDTALNSGGLIGADGDADGMRNGALPNAGDAVNDYETEAADAVTVPALALDKVDVDPGLAPEIGAHKPFEIRVDLPEGVSEGVTLSDALDSGNASYVLADNADFGVSYEFVNIASINGQPPAGAEFNAVPADGTSGAALWDVGTVTTEIEDDAATADVTPYIRISYAGRINNDLDTNVGSSLQNAATLAYTNGDSGGSETLEDTTPAIAAIEPNLTATKAIANVTPGKAAGDPIELNDIVEYTLTIPNIGTATAYDVNISDTLPPELTLYAGYTPTAQVNGVEVTGFAATPAGAPNGPLVWGAGNGDASLDVAAGETLEVSYRVELVAPADEDIAITNIVWVDWTSRQDDDVYERTGAGCPVTTAPDDYCYGPASADGTPYPVGPPDPLTKANTQPTATIGEAFRYRITIPATPHALPMYDVRIADDLEASAADLSYAGVSKVSGSGTWTPVNSGDAKNLVIEDTAAGIDIPIGEQVVLDVTVRLDDTATNVAGLTFTNLASYTYNRLDNAPATELEGGSGLTQPMTVVEPYDLTVEKDGPAQMQLGLAGTFSLDVHNVGDSPAFGVTVYDVLPNGDDGGMCDDAPTGFTAQVFEADGTTAVSGELAEGTDFSVAFAGDPDCTLTVTALTPAAAIGPDERLIVGYRTHLDLDSEQGATLTNVAGATEWAGLDVADDANEPYARTYTRTLTDGTVDTLDHEDAHSIVVFAPVLIFEKTVANLTSGEDPAATATPGDTLRYSLRVENASDTPLDGFRIVDELDELNSLPAFEPGSLTLVTVPEGADTGNTDPAGGAAGTGLLDVGGLSLGGLGEEVLLEFDVTLAPALPDESFVYNQSEVRFAELPVAVSDDPYVNGAADPEVAGDEDPTRVQIESAPAFDVDKVSAYVTGDPNVLLAGETLRYTITVRNTGTDHAAGVTIADQVPANTRYLAGSTTLNGAPVPDAADGGSPLTDGIEINAPGDTTPGVMNAASADNTATIVFDVEVYPDVADGTVISNQAFVSAVDHGIADVPSDDPRTPVADDPTQDVVGNYPLLFAPKTARLVEDATSPGIVDPGDVLRYTITVYNNGAVPATYVELRDEVPNDTTYVADSTTVNGQPAGPDGGAFPLTGGLAVSGADLTPPLPGESEGTINPGESAVVEFDVRVDDMTPTGTLITNQAVVSTEEVPDVLTDGDGNPATGPEPTVVVVGDAQALSIVKDVAVVGGGPAVAGAVLEYTVTATNVAALPALYVAVTDDLDEVTPGYITYVDQSATMNGLTGGVAFAGTTITADYFGEYGELPPGETVRLRFRATIGPALEDGTRITNLARVAWNDPTQYAEASVSIDVGGVPNSGMLSGNVFHDADHDDSPDAVERALEGWSVELLRDDEPVRAVQTDAEGNYLLNGVPPNYLNGQAYAIRFSAPGAGSRTAAMGVTDSDFTDGLQRIDEIVVQGGSNLRQLNMPVDPNGVVYNSVARSPVAGATVTMLYADNGQALPSSCFDDPNQQGQVTVANGYYKFDLNFSDPACPSGDGYRIEVVAPDTSYVGGESELIPSTADPFGRAFDVPACPGSADDAVVATSDYCEAQPSEFAPPPGVRARSDGTRYHTFLELDDSAAEASAQLYNNHIPLDPRLGGAVSVTKSTPMLNVMRGDMVPYVITVSNSFGVDLQDVNLVDRFPAGFRYVEGSARFDDAPAEPAVIGRELIWSDLSLTVDGRHTIKLLLAIGAGVSEGEFTNRALAMNALTGGVMSEEAEATVRIVPDPTFDCTDVTGKVFDDLNLNGYQDGDETGIAGVRVVTARGLAATTDQHGRYHFTCAVVPNEFRGSNFILKLDDRTLPSGFRPTTRPVQLNRATRGKALRVNFGATIHRVVGLDLADPVFVPGEVEVREQWRHRIDLLIEELGKGPSILRLSYVADVEEKALVDARLDEIVKRIRAEWRQVDAYELVIEPEIFWRLGGPPETPKVRKK